MYYTKIGKWQYNGRILGAGMKGIASKNNTQGALKIINDRELTTTVGIIPLSNKYDYVRS